jgi:hypothetical protein
MIYSGCYQEILLEIKKLQLQTSKSLFIEIINYDALAIFDLKEMINKREWESKEWLPHY